MSTPSPPNGLPPPRRLLSSLVFLGPGLVLAGSIVGSGELIATTTTGARAGFTLLWLIVLGCVVKVFAQVELGRAAVTHGRTALGALDELPGPRLRAGWGVWAWVVMTTLTLAQQGGIVGAIGSTLSLAVPLTDAGTERERLADEVVGLEVSRVLGETVDEGRMAAARSALDAAREADALGDPLLWATLVTLVTCVLLGVGRYRLVQSVAIVTVGAFTMATLATLVLLQRAPEWAVSGAEIRAGLSFSLPPSNGGVSPIGTALATFGMIGVGAAELVAYPYWCLEKGYARWTGARDGSPAWFDRARGWLRVMRIDAWLSAVVYTVATVAFYLLGAAVLGRAGLDPGRDELVRTLAAMYEPVFGDWARPVFLAGAFCVLYSTFFVAAAGTARVAADALIRLELIPNDEPARLRWIRVLSVSFPILSYVVFALVRAPLGLVLAGGIAQALMLPVLAACALHLRFRRTTEGLAPGRAWDAALVVSSAGLVLAGGWTVWSLLRP